MSPEEAAAFYETEPVDIAIIGGGPAAFSAAINGLTRGRSVVILSGKYQDSYLYKASELINVPGFPGESGAEILDKLSAHAAGMGSVTITGRALVVMPFDFGTSETGPIPGFQIAYGSEILMARTVILATGSSVAAPYPGEDKFLGRGVSYCATCDGMLYRGRDVAVIAKAGDAVEEALHLVKIGCRVNLFVNPSDLKRWGITLPENTFTGVHGLSNLVIEGEDTVTGLSAGGQEYPAACVFILRSSIAPESLLSGLAVANNYIQADRNQATNIPGVFAAGDCTGKPLQVAKAMGEGQVAALSADAYLSAQETASGKAGKAGTV